jgi:hypothetical protein
MERAKNVERAVDLFDTVRSVQCLEDVGMRRIAAHRLFHSLSAKQTAELIERSIKLCTSQPEYISKYYSALCSAAIDIERRKSNELVYAMDAAIQNNYFLAAAFCSKTFESNRKGKFTVDPELADLPLGHQKSKARQANESNFERFFTVRHVHVQEILLNNPRMTEKYMVRYAAQKHLPESLGVLISISDKWSQSLPVLEALVQNRSTPSWIAIKWLPLLHRDARKSIHKNLSNRTDLGRFAKMLLM